MSQLLLVRYFWAQYAFQTEHFELKSSKTFLWNSEYWASRFNLKTKDRLKHKDGSLYIFKAWVYTNYKKDVKNHDERFSPWISFSGSTPQSKQQENIQRYTLDASSRIHNELY